MLDNTFVPFGSASSAFHTSRNYPIILAGGNNIGFQHGRYLKYGQADENDQTEPGHHSGMTAEELPLSHLYLSMLQNLPPPPQVGSAAINRIRKGPIHV